MRPWMLIAALLALAPSAALAEQVTFRIEVSEGDTPERLILAGGTMDTDLNAEFDDNGVATISLTTGAYRSQPRTLVLKWEDGETEDFPVFLLPELAGETVHMLFVGKAFGPANQAAPTGSAATAARSMWSRRSRWCSAAGNGRKDSRHAAGSIPRNTCMPSMAG